MYRSLTEKVLLDDNHEAFLTIGGEWGTKGLGKVRLDILLPHESKDLEEGPLKEWVNQNTELRHFIEGSIWNHPRISLYFKNIKTESMICAVDAIRASGITLTPKV